MVYYNYSNVNLIINIIIMITIQDENALLGYYERNVHAITKFLSDEGESIVKQRGISTHNTSANNINLKISFDLSNKPVGEQLAFISYFVKEKDKIETKRLSVSTALNYNVPSGFEKNFKYLVTRLPPKDALRHCFKIEEGNKSGFSWKDAKLCRVQLVLRLETPILNTKPEAIKEQVKRMEGIVEKHMNSFIKKGYDIVRNIKNNSQTSMSL